ncbi:MAG: protein prkA [Deltaproteobacteria bacterium]|nr:protein prkA [Deltaproteobacteria bacterium]MBW2121133.1 protein prkA [Deltaproteobacteria bacterium]
MDFKKIIEESRKEDQEDQWEGTCLEYMELIKENPSIAQLAPGRLYNMVIDKGSQPIEDSIKLPDYEDMVRYNFFQDELYGLEEPLHDIMRFFKAGARRTETGKRILILVGPVSSGKSTIASLLKRGLERDPTPIYAIKGCPMHEEPLHLIPKNQRAKWEKILGVRIEGDLCPLCRFNLLENEQYRDDEGNVLWESFPVVRIRLDEAGRTGIGTFQPSDPKNQDVAELIGRVDLSKITQYGETDPRAYSLDGELEIANRGLMEYVEILKCDIKFHYILITVAQEQVLKAPGFPQIYVDEVILSHTNQTEFDKFKSIKENEALHDRMYPIFVPYNLKVKEEEKIYKKMIERSEFRQIHLAPYTLNVAAQFAVLTRLTDSQICPNPIKKMKYYNGDPVAEKEKDQVDLVELRLEGKKKGEGMSGISPRFVVNALNVALGEKEGVGCVNPLDAIRALRANFEHHIGFTEEEKTQYMGLLVGEKDSVLSEFKELAKKEVNRAFLFAYEDQAQALFENYMKNATAFCLKKKIRDPVTNEDQEPDEKLMRSIEEMIGVSENAKKEFRQGIFVFKSDAIDQGREFNFNTYTPLQEAIERKLIGDLRNVVSLTIADKTRKDPKTLKRRKDAVDALQKKGYCPVCAENLLQFVGDVLRKEE